jgi:hypothetical protein
MASKIFFFTILAAQLAPFSPRTVLRDSREVKKEDPKHQERGIPPKESVRLSFLWTSQLYFQPLFYISIRKDHPMGLLNRMNL